MDLLKEQAKKYTSGGINSGSQGDSGLSSHDSSGSANQSSSGGGGFLNSITGKLNSAAGGGVEGEKNEDYLDKGVDYAQQKFMGGGDQSNESAVEQAKDEQISDFIRDKYKSMSGSDIPIKDKPTTFDRKTD